MREVIGICACDFKDLQNLSEVWIVIDCMNEDVTSVVLKYAEVPEACGSVWQKIQARAMFQRKRKHLAGFP